MSDNLMKELIQEIKSLHETIAIMQQDINCIRNGEYDKPSGATPKAERRATITLEEIREKAGMAKDTP